MSAPASRFAAITPNDSTDLGQVAALYIGVTGDVALVNASEQADQTPVVFKNVPAGTVLPVRCRKVRATGTTATNIVALFL